MKWRFLLLMATCFLLFAGSQISAQEVFVSYADGVGSIIKYKVADGSVVSRVQKVYQVGGITYRSNKIALIDSSFYYVMFGNRYLGKLRSNDGSIVWVVDAGATHGFTTQTVTDIAITNNGVFVSNQDPDGRITKYRLTDGGLIWSVQRGVQVGVLKHVPLRLAADGSDSFFVLLGAKFLSKMRQSDGAVLWQKDISLMTGTTTWGVADLTASGGFAYVSNLDPSGTIRKFSNNGSLVWSILRTHQVGSIKYVATKLAATGTDTVMVLFGDRYLARLKTVDGQIFSVKDVGLQIGFSTAFATDIAAIVSP